MPKVIKQKAIQLEPVLGSYGACKFSHIFPVEMKLPSQHNNYVNDMYIATTRQ